MIKEDLWKILDEVSESIKLAESKALAIIGTSGIILAFLFSRNDIFNQINTAKTDKVILLISSISFLAAIISAFICLKPRFRVKSTDSLIFFRSISKLDKSDYLNKLKNLDSNNDSIELQISERILSKSGIAKKKFRAVNISVYAFLIFLITLLSLLFKQF